MHSQLWEEEELNKYSLLLSRGVAQLVEQNACVCLKSVFVALPSVPRAGVSSLVPRQEVPRGATHLYSHSPQEVEAGRKVLDPMAT